MAQRRIPTCPICGKEFAGAGKRYCSPECRKEAKKRRQTIDRFCPICGKQILIPRKRYCSDECRKEAELRNEKRRRESMGAIPKSEYLPYMPKVSIREVVIKATKLGITYGEWVRRYDP